MKISVIIPVYNGAQYIPTCFDSLLKQTYSDWEAIFINDGSTDNSLELLNALVKKDTRIKVESQRNMGVVFARDKGVQLATGEWVFFLDVDDTLPPLYMASMIQGVKENVDIVYSGYHIVNEARIIKERVFEDKYLNSLDFLKMTMRGYYPWELCGKLYRRHLFCSSVQIPKGIRIGEDAAVNVQLISRCRKVHVINTTAYNYIQYQTSASHIISLNRAEETIQAAFFIVSYLKKLKLYEQIADECKAMCLLFFTNSTRRGYLGNNHPLVRKVFKECMTWKTLQLIPLSKRVYVVFCRMFGKIGNHLVMKLS